MSVSVTLDGTEVTKHGSDAECFFHLWLGDGKQAYENIAAENFQFDPINPEVAKVLNKAGVDWKDLKDFASRNHLDISFGGHRGYKTKNGGRHFPQGKNKDNSQKFKIGNQYDLDNIASALNDDDTLTTTGAIKFGGTEVFSYEFDKGTNSFTYKITISVTAYTSWNGNLDTSKAAITEFEPSILQGSLEAYDYKSKIEICSGFTNCKAKNKNGETVEQVMNGLGFKLVRDGNGRYISDKEYKLTASTCNELGVKKDAISGKYSGASNTFFYIFPTKYFCDLATDKLCASFKNVEEGECTNCPVLHKDKSPGYRLFRDADNDEKEIPGGCEDNSCKISEGYKKPMYEALAKHLAAAGFTQILPSTFNPVNIQYDPGGGDESEVYTFVGYEMAGEYLERTNIGSKSNVLVDIKDKPINIFSAKAVKGATTIKRNPDGTLPADYANDLAFATTSEGLDKMVEKNSVHHGSDHVFTETVYLNTVKETVWQMAEVWRQTAMITLNKQNVPYGSRPVYNEKIYAVGAVEEQNAYVFGTELDLDRMVFEAYENQASAAGYALNSKNLSFNLDLTYSEQGGNGGSKTARGSTSISFKDIIRNYLANHDKSDEERKQNFTDTLTVSLDNFEVNETGEVVYDIEDINVSYSTNLWNNVELDFGFDPFVSNDSGKEAWETFEAQATWKIDDGKMMILSADAVGRIGLEASWRIDSKDPDTYRGQSQLRKLIAQGFDGAIVAGGMMFDPVTQKATPSLSLAKSFNEAVSTSISLTSASVTAKLKKEYGGEGDWYGQLDIAAQATFGVDYSDFFKNHDPSKINGKDVEELAGKEHSRGNDYEAFKKFARASLDINYKANLITLGNNFGNIVFSAKTSATLGQANGVIQGITFRAAGTWEVKWENSVIYDIFGLPANIHPTIGGQVGFSMHKVKSRYFGTEYSGHQFAVGFGVFGLTWELHNRRTVIKQILQRKRYGSLFSLFGVLEWEEDKETDEDYIARAWPCLVYNIINWAKEDFKTKKYDPDVAAMKASIFPKNKPPICEQLKSNTDVGILFSDFYRDTFATGTAGVRFLDYEAQDFYNGKLNGQSGYKTHLGIDHWDHWVWWEDVEGQVKQNGSIRFPEHTPAPVGPPILNVSLADIKGKWIDQNGNTISGDYVAQVRQYNAAWSNWPNMQPDNPPIGQTWESLQGQLASSTFAYLYYLRDVAWGADPCSYLFARWKRWYMTNEQQGWVLRQINTQLYTQGQALQNEIAGLTKDRSTSDSLFDMFLTLLKKPFKWIVRGTNGDQTRTDSIQFNYKEFLDKNKSLVSHKAGSEGTPIAPVAGAGNTVGASFSQPWVGWANHNVTTFDGASKNMAMITQPTSKEVLNDSRDPKEKDLESALELFYADPAWGLVKCYFTYMAPIGQHEARMDDPKNPGKKIDNKEYYLPYDPRTSAARLKRLEIRARNNKILNKQVLVEDLNTGNTAANAKPFNADATKIVQGVEKELYRDEYGNLNVDLFKDHRPGWVYRQRGSQGTMGDIVWVVPTPDLYRFDHAFAYDDDGKITVGEIGSSILKLTGSKAEKLTNVCKAGGQSGGFWNFWRRLFGSDTYFLDQYRSLPWIYTDSTNEAASPTVNSLIDKDRFKYYPKDFNSPLTLPFPVKNDENLGYEGSLSYQEVPWKGNNNSSYLDFYEFMTAVEMEAKNYFFPELIESVDAKKVHTFCVIKERAVKAFGILEKDYILEDCKSCTTCNVRPADKGSDPSGADALGEVVGLRSMLGEPANPSNETNVSLSTSVASHNTDRPWYEYHSNSSQFGSLVNVWIGGEGVGYEPYGGKSFDSLYEKFEYVKQRLDALGSLRTACVGGGTTNTGAFQNNVSIIGPFDEDQTFEFPNSTDANRVTYSYKKGESLSNAREIASLRDIVNRHFDGDVSSNSKRLVDVSFSVLNMLDDFNQIAAEPKHCEGRNAQHKYTKSTIHEGANSLASTSLGKQGCFGSTADIASAVNTLVDMTKPIAQNLSNPRGSGIRAVVLNLDGLNTGNTNSASRSPAKDKTSKQWVTKFNNAKQQAFLNTSAAHIDDAQATVGTELFTVSHIGGAFANNFGTQPHLSESYIDYSYNLVKNFMGDRPNSFGYSSLEWIFSTQSDKSISEPFGGIQNNDIGNVQLLKEAQLAYFWNYIASDLLASRYMVSVALTPWSYLALDVLDAYWSNKIDYVSCIWHLNRRLWPLITAMNQASPNIYTNDKVYSDLVTNTDYTTMLMGFGLNLVKNPTLSRDFYQGPSFSQYDPQGNLSPLNEWVPSTDDVVFAHRNNVLRLLFKFDSIDELIPKRRSALTETQKQNIITKTMPIYILGKYQANADNHIQSFYNVQANIVNHIMEFGLMNSLCGLLSHAHQRQYGSSMRPNGRNRFETNRSNFLPISGEQNYIARVIGDDPPINPNGYGRESYYHQVESDYNSHLPLKSQWPSTPKNMGYVYRKLNFTGLTQGSESTLKTALIQGRDLSPRSFNDLLSMPMQYHSISMGGGGGFG